MRTLHALLLPSLLALLGCAYCQAVEPRFSITIHARHDVVKLGSPIPVDITLQNKSSAELLDIEVCPVELTFDTQVFDSRGGPIPLAALGHIINEEGGAGLTYNCGGIGPRRPGFGLKPGQRRKVAIDVSRIYDFSRPSQYSIQVQRRDSVTNTLVRSNSITVTVADATEWEQYLEKLQKPFAITISTPEPTIKAGSALLLEMFLTNGLDHPVVIDNALTKYDVEVLDSHGKLAPLTTNGQDLRKKIGWGGGPRFTVQPGDDLRGGVYVDKLYDISRPGQYTIQVARTDEDSKVVVKSNTITVNVTP